MRLLKKKIKSNFFEYSGDLIGLPTDSNHLVYRWDYTGCKILFSMCRQGNAASCHFASDKKGLRKLKTSVIEFIDFVFTNFDWCEMIFAKIIPNSVKKLSESVGFEFLTSTEKSDVYYLVREKYYEFYR